MKSRREPEVACTPPPTFVPLSRLWGVSYLCRTYRAIPFPASQQRLYRSWRPAVDTVRCGKSRRVNSILGASGRSHRGALDQDDQDGRSPIGGSWPTFAALA